MRQSRKLDHLNICRKMADGPGTTGFADFHPVHNCLPELAWDDVRLDTEIAGIHLRHPLIINAITGGAADVAAVNAALAELALTTGAAMAVGSQYAALENPEVLGSYEVIREVNPGGVLFANVGAHVTPEQACQAVEMIGADALQVHLNAGQELVMPEGDRNFSRYLDHIAAIAARCRVPVIAKEVGCGIAREQALALTGAGVRAIDVGGRGGTNFLAIEAARGQNELEEDFLAWGIPTAVSAAEVAAALERRADLIVSGGVRSSLDALKALIIGGQAVAVAGPLVKLLNGAGPQGAIAWVEAFLEGLKRCMVLVGAGKVSELAGVPLVITGWSREWLTARGVDVTRYAVRPS